MTELTPAQKLIARMMSEAELQRNVDDCARTFGWLVHGERAAMRQSGRWSTPIEGDAGFPDRVLMRVPYLLLIELKTETGKLSEAQKRWYETGMVILWRPSDWLDGTIERVLRQ